MPQLDAKLSQILDELQKAAAKYAPGALTLGLDTIRAVAIIHMAWAALALLIFTVLLIVFIRTYWIWHAPITSVSPPGMPVALNIISAIAGAIFFIAVLVQVFSLTNWLALIDPRLALAKMILDRVGLVP